ncbi:nucleolin-like isoform X2 [Papaver somniferum]|uniref:nucleolin-like isoform X2 n=1 Tax=Papaver somniferum TaxID=3469 RepID=UPI000E7012A1|nr:nucleolin-like isoform X2 [Papaver somniferum]
MPLRSCENGRILLGLEMGDASLHMILYDPKDESSEHLRPFQVARECLLSTSAYVESLVSLNSGTYLWQGQVECSKEEDGYYLDVEEYSEEDSDSDSDEEYDYGFDEEDDYGSDEEHIGEDSEEDNDEDDEEDDEQEDTESSKKKREEDDKEVLNDIRKMFTTLKKPKM